jgi:VWFA-related protein
MLKRSLLALLALVLFSASLLTWTRFGQAQESTPPRIVINSIDDSDFPTLRLLVTVTDENRFPITSLAANDFGLKVNGQTQTISSVENITNENLAISVVLVIDTSESMSGNPMEDTRQAALAFVDKLGPNDQIAVVDFDSDIQVTQGFTNNFDDARAAIASLQAGGRTALWDGAYQGVDLASTAPGGRRFVILLTDGNEFGGLSQNSREAAIKLGDDLSIPVYTIGLGYSVDQPYLSELAESTGGQFNLYPDSGELSQLYEFLADYLRKQYIFTLEAAPIEPDGATNEITLEALGAERTRRYVSPDLYPQISLRGLPEGELSEAATVQVSVTAPRGLDSVEVSLGGQALRADTGAVGGSYEESFTIQPYDLAPGEQVLRVIVTDAEGGQRGLEQSFTVAQLPAQFTLEGLEPGDLLESPSLPLSVEVIGSQSRVEGVEVNVDGQTLTTLRQGPYNTSVDVLALGPGEHTLEVAVVEAGGNRTAKEISFSVSPALFVTPTAIPTNTPLPTNTPAPTATPLPPTATPSPEPQGLEFNILGLEEGDILAEPVEVTVEVEGTAEAVAGVDFLINGASVSSSTESPYTYTIDTPSLRPGDYTFEVRVRAQNGAVTSESLDFSISGLVASPTPAPTEAAQLVPTATPIPPTNTPIPATVTATATATPNPVSFVITGLPEGEIETPTVDLQLDLSAEDAERVAGVQYSVDGEVIAEVDEAPFGTELEVIPLGPGEHELEVTVTQADGQTVTESTSFTVSAGLFITPTATLTQTASPIPATATSTATATVTITPAPPANVDVEGEEEGGMNPLILGGLFLLLLAIIAFVLFSRRGRDNQA